MRHSDAYNHFLLMLLSSIWAASLLLAQFLLFTFSSIELAFLRCLGAVLVLLPFVKHTGLDLFSVNCVVATLLAVVSPLVALNLGVAQLGAGLSAIVITTTPVLACMVGALYFDKPMTRREKLFGIGILLTLTALVLSLRLPMQTGSLIGLLAIMIECILSAVWAHLSARQLKTRTTAIQLTFSTHLLGMLLFSPFVVFDVYARTTLAAVQVSLGLFNGILASVIGYLLFYKLVNRVGANFASRVNYLVPTLTIFASSVLYDQENTKSMVVALVIIMFCLWSMQRRNS